MPVDLSLKVRVTSVAKLVTKHQGVGKWRNNNSHSSRITERARTKVRVQAKER